MKQETFTLAMAVIVCGTFIAIFGLVADCSKQNTRTEANPQKACLEAGGAWQPGDGLLIDSYCAKPSK